MSEENNNGSSINPKSMSIIVTKGSLDCLSTFHSQHHGCSHGLGCCDVLYLLRIKLVVQEA